MALLDTEGFGWASSASDLTSYGPFTSASGVTVNTGGPAGDNYVSLAGSGALTRTFPSHVTSFFFGLRFNLNGIVGGSASLVFLSSGGNAQFGLAISSATGTVTLWRGMPLSGNLLATASTNIPTGGWCYLEVGVVLSATTGTVQVHLNGASILSASSINNEADPTNPNVALVSIVSGSTSPSSTHWYLTDNTGSAPWNTFLGDVRVQTLKPTANNAVAFTPIGAASNWQNAADVPAEPNSFYNTSTLTTGVLDDFTKSALDSSFTTVYGLVQKTIAQAIQSNFNCCNVISSSGTVSVGATISVGMTAEQLMTVFELDPHTSAAWTPSGASAAIVGYEIP